jgi:alpha-beta hydrolase superfamily lysophospholipase
MEHAEGSFQGWGRLDLYCQHWRPDGVPRAALAVVHGFGEHSGRYRNLVDWFVPKGYSVHAFDLRGNGRSPGRRGYLSSFDEFREDVGIFLARVRDREPKRPLFLVGHSQGGLIVLNYVLHDPSGLAGVVASGPALGALPVSPALILLARLLSNIWPGLTLATGLEVEAISRDKSVVEAYIHDPLVHNLGTPRLGTELMAAIKWTQAHAAGLALPCLIVHGSGDRICPPQASQAFFEKATLADKERHEYQGYYHEVLNDFGKELVLSDIEDWLERHL